jgi:hypothetical protein
MRGFLQRMTGKRERERAFLENGGKVLEVLVSACNGRPIPIRTFSYQELSRATNSFDPRLVVNNEKGNQNNKPIHEFWLTNHKNYC